MLDAWLFWFLNEYQHTSTISNVTAEGNYFFAPKPRSDEEIQGQIHLMINNMHVSIWI